MFRAQQIRRHHRRQDKSYNARNENGAGERERKFSEKRAGQSALQRDWCVNRGERDRHGDDRTDQFARANQRCLHARHSFTHVALDVFDHNDRVIDHQSDRQHDREQGEEIEGEAEQLHQKQRADQRNRDRDYRHNHRSERAEEQKDYHHHDE